MTPYERGYTTAMKCAGLSLDRLRAMLNPEQFVEQVPGHLRILREAQNSFFDEYRALPQGLNDVRDEFNVDPARMRELRQQADRMAAAVGTMSDAHTAAIRRMRQHNMAARDAAMAKGLLGGAALGTGGTMLANHFSE